VIQAVKAVADEQGIKTLRLTGHNKIPIYPANWIAGVEYDDNNENENEHNDQEDLFVEGEGKVLEK
jgi:hypothetical protein